jgi:hypothetical protein
MKSPAAAPSTPVIPIRTYFLDADAGLGKGVLDVVVFGTSVVLGVDVLIVVVVAFAWLLDPVSDPLAVAVVFR